MFKDGKEILYFYTIKNGKLFVHEGTVKSMYDTRKRVCFSDRSSPRRYPNQFNVIDTTGPNIWLTERNDEAVKRIFIEYEEQKLAELEEQIERKKQIIKMLKEGA